MKDGGSEGKRNMNQTEFVSAMRKARGMERVEIARAGFWIGYSRGIMRGYFGQELGTDGEHMEWWAMAESGDLISQERGRGYRAGLRCASRENGYCTKNNFTCETCFLAISGRDCHENPVIQE